MNEKDFKAKNLVYNRYVTVDNGNIDFNSELKSFIDKNDISQEDAINIIYELMYCVINYNYDENEVNNELYNLIDKIKGYNSDEEIIKNSVIFFKDYSHEKDLINTFKKCLKDGEKVEDSKVNILNSYYKSKYPANGKKFSPREIRQIDEEIRMLGAYIRKENPHDWREILKSTTIYKIRHGIDDNENKDKNTSINIKKTD